MKIIIIGNIASGKSTISEFIKTKYKKTEIVAIDAIRKKFGDGTVAKEKECKNRLIEMVNQKKKMQVIEISGVGELGERLFYLLDKLKCQVLVIYLRVSIEEINKRIVGRDWDTPIPFTKDNIPIAIKYTHEQFETGLLQRLISRCSNAVAISLSNDNIQLLKRNVEIIQQNIKLLEKL